MGDVSVSLLGGFGAEVDGVAVPPKAWRLKKARELVKLLALAPGHRLHREQAMDVLWRDLPPAAAANNLHQAVHVARRTLDPESDRAAGRGSLAHRERRRRPVRACSRGRAAPRDTRRLPGCALALRRRAPAREPLRRLGGRPPRGALGPRGRARGGVGSAWSLEAVRTAGRRKLVHRPCTGAGRAEVAAAAHTPPDSVRDRRGGEDAARARAGPRRRTVVRSGRSARRARRPRRRSADSRGSRSCPRHSRPACA